MALSEIKRQKTLSKLPSLHEAHPNQIRQWKKKVIDELPHLFSLKRKKADRDQETLIDELYKQIGELKVKLDWLKKNLLLSVEIKRSWIDPDHPHISISRQCELVGLPRSGYYYQSKGETRCNVSLMNMINTDFRATLPPNEFHPKKNLWIQGTSPFLKAFSS